MASQLTTRGRRRDAASLRVTGLPPHNGDDPRKQLLLAVEDGEVTGYVDLLTPDDGSPTTGHIRYLWYDPGHRKAGEALLDAAEQALAEAGAERVQAFGPGIMPFHKNLSDRCVHIRALFTIRGYELTGGELYINWDNFAESLERLKADAEMPAGITVTVEEYYWDEERKRGGRKTPRPSLRLFALDADGEKLGICEHIAANEYDDAAALADTGFVSWLGVPPERGNLNPAGYDRREASQG